MSIVKKYYFDNRGDDRGSLIALESSKNIPFEIKRIYYIYNTTPDLPRGFHAHKKTKQVIICISGSCRIVLDDATHREEIVLNDPATGLLIEDLIWHEMHDLSKNCILLTLASEYYDESDYVRNYRDFLKIKGIV